MATEVNLINTLVNKADGKLANTDNIYDKVQKAMQELLNKRLAHYFVFDNEGEMWDGKIDGKALQDGTIDANKLSPNIQTTLGKSTELTEAINQLNLIAWGIQSSLNNLTERVTELERVQDNTVLSCEEDGFFLVDENLYVGACLTPLYCLGWDGEVNTGGVPTYAKTNGGHYIIIKGANFNASGSEMNLGQLGAAAVAGYLSLSVLSNSNNTVRVKAIPGNDSYAGQYYWYLRNNTEYFYLKSGQYTDTAEFTIGPGANNFSITIYCSAAGTENEIQITVNYVQPAVAVGYASIQLYNAYGHTSTSSSDPIVAPSFQMKVNYQPSNATISGYNWILPGSNSPFTVASTQDQHSQICTFNISQSATTVTNGLIACEITDTLGNTVSSTAVSVYVKYAATPEILNNLRGIQTNVPSSMQANEQEVEVFGLYEVVDGQSTSTRKALAAPEEYTLEIESGHAVIKDNNVISLTDDATLNEEIIGKAIAANPNYDSSDESSVENFESIFRTSCAYQQPLKSLKINVLNQNYDGNILFLGVVSDPDIEAYRSVTWRVVVDNPRMGRFITIDSETGRLEILAGVIEYTKITVTAQSNVDTSIFAEPLYLNVKYDNTSRPIRLIRPLAAVGDQYIDFSAVGHTGNIRDDYTDISQTRLKWEVVEIVSAEQAQEAIVYWNQHNYGSIAPVAPKAQTMSTLPVNGTSNGTMVATETNTDLSEAAITTTMSNTAYYPMDAVTSYVGLAEASGGSDINAPIIAPVVFTPTASDVQMPSRGPMRSGTTISTPTFGTGSDDKNRLYLANTSDGLQQGVCVRCTLLDESDPTIEIKHIDYYYEFTYRSAGRLPVKAIGFRQTAASNKVTVLPNGNITIAAPYTDSWISLKEFVVPLVNGEYVEGQCLFDPEKLHFSSNHGHNDSDNWHVAGYSGKVKVSQSGTEELTVSYALLGEMPYYTKQHDKIDYDEYQSTGLHHYYNAANRINKTVSAALTKETKTFSTNAIQIQHESSYTVTVVNQNYYVDNQLNNVWSVLDGIPLRITDMSGNPVLDQNNNVMSGTFRIVSGQEYCSIGINGSPMRIGNTGTTTGDNTGNPVARQVTVEATLGDMKDTKSFTVKMIMQNNA